MQPLESASIDCPYCGESIDILLDPSVEHQHYVEDCSVCCRPIALTVTVIDEENVEVVVHRENE